jgi:hypothetical protein
MSNNQQENQQLNDRLAESLLQVNKLLYKMPPQIGIASERKYVTDFFQQSTYNNGETMVLDAQTGSSFIDGRNSYIRLQVTPNLAGDFATGSSVNIIARIVVRSRTGRELCRLEDANLFTKYMQRYHCPKDWFDTAGPSQGYADANLADATTLGSRGKGLSVMTGGVVFVIPMSIIPFYDQERLIPPQIQEGIRIELSLDSPANAFAASGGAVTSYTVTNPECHWDSITLADQFRRKVAEMAAKQGLNLLHHEQFHTLVQNSSTQFNFDVKKAASKALKCRVISRATAVINAGLVDSMASELYQYTRQQSHIGAVYYPNQPLETNVFTQAGNNESYYNTLSAMDKLKCWNSCAVSNFSYQSGSSLASGLPNDAMIATCLNKSQVSNKDGMVVNNSRALLYDITFGGIAVSRRLDVYLEHLRAVKVFASNVEVRD